jgi:glycosyltransferase involved in cell wall biosynthesis
MILVITRWFPSKAEPIRSVFNRHILDAQSRFGEYDYTLISPVPYYPRIKLPYMPDKFIRFAQIEYKEVCNNYNIYRPKYFKLPHPFAESTEWHTYYHSVMKVIETQQLKFDLIHCHGLYPDGFAAARIAQRAHVPLVMHIHESGFRKSYHKYNRSIRYVMNQADKLITVSKFQYDTVTDTAAEFAGKTCVVYNGIDTEKFSPSAQTSVGKSARMIFVGNLIEGKQIDILIKAIDRLKTKFSLTLDIYGSGPKQKQYQQLTWQLNLTHLVKFKGNIENDTLAETLKNYYLLVLPSRYETFGVVLIEAMACGLPVVAAAVGAVPEIVDSDDVGILAQPDSVDSLTQALEKALVKQWDRNKITTYAQKFSVKNTVRSLDSIYSEILHPIDVV